MYGIETIAVHAGENRGVNGLCVPTVVLTGNKAPYENITLENLERCVASLEHAKYALCLPSGTAATTTVAQILEEGDHVIVFDSVYHGTRTYWKICEDLQTLSVSFVDLRDASVLKKHITDKTKMVWIETPCNPTIKIVDIGAVVAILKKHSSAFLVVDNTFMSPCFQNPLGLGADVVMHSMTKYMNGHADCLMGALATSNKSIFDRLKSARDITGSIPSPMECYLVHRGLKTLPLRMRRHMENAFEVARHLEKHPKVERVFYPGLPSHPQHKLAKKQCKGFSGMVSFCIKGGTEEASRFVQNLKVFTLAVSLGSVESLIEIPSMMTASALSREQRQLLEIPDNLLRVSVGLESAKDLIADIDQAFDKV